MPTLARRQDGCYIVRGFHGGFLTWQIAAEGVLYLRRKGVNAEDPFSDEIFFHLMNSGWVHTGDQPNPQPLPPLGWDHNLPSDLSVAVRDFHVALRNSDASAADALTWRPVLNDDGVQSADVETSTKYSRIDQWRPLEGKPWKLPSEDRAAFGAEDFATVTVRIWSPELSSPVDHREYWYKARSGWRVVWAGFPEQPQATG